ncbi:MAG: hypothetical protein WBA57_23635 [Elainellaceae cyanobacterium]
MTLLSTFVLYLGLTSALLLGALILQSIPLLGTWTKPISQRLTHAPGLDAVVAYFTVLPLVVSVSKLGGWGIVVAVAAEVSAVMAWTFVDERVRSPQTKTVSMHMTLGKIVGKWRNHAALWITALAVPTFWIVRVAEWIVYPPLTGLIRLPAYDAKDWVNVSRQKFEGLIGYDLIWCLYCDWMTGVWSLGTEMLRNVESFWCPIRFSSEKKCENCKVDFPDVNSNWVPSTGTISEVNDLLRKEYDHDGDRSWHGHPSRKDHSS